MILKYVCYQLNFLFRSDKYVCLHLCTNTLYVFMPARMNLRPYVCKRVCIYDV